MLLPAHEGDPPAQLHGGSPHIRRYLTCHHEAGHAIVALALGLDVVHVILEDPKVTGRYGSTRILGPVTTTTAPAWGAALTAGHLASARAAAELGVQVPPEGHSSDDDHDRWCEWVEPHGIDLWDAIVTANHTLTAYWPDVQRLAHELRAHGHVDVAKWTKGKPL